VSSVLLAEALGWSRSSRMTTEVDLGGSDECRDPCVAATRDGTFVVAFASPNAKAHIYTRYSEDPVAGTWSEPREVCPDGDVNLTQGTQNFPSLSIDEDNQLCFICWEDKEGGAVGSVATSNGAMAELGARSSWYPLPTPLGSWTPLGILTGHEVPPEDTADSSEADSTRYPCVVATSGHPQVFYRGITDDNAVLVRRFGKWT
jgi:hypothetical protein